MVPLARPPQADLAGTPVLILSGSTDPIIPAENAARLAAILKGMGSEVDHRTLPAGHSLTQGDITITTTWLDQR